MHDNSDTASGHDAPADPFPASWKDQPEADVWWSRQGQISNWSIYLGLLVVFVGAGALAPAPLSYGAMLITLAGGAWQWAQAYMTAYRVSTHRIQIYTGVFAPDMNPIEFYRVNDYRVHKPFIYRLAGRGNLWIYSDDTNRPVECFTAIKAPESVEELLRNIVEPERRRAGTRVIE